MALKFKCQHCNDIIISNFLKVGELAECKKCGEKSTIPQDAEEAPDTIYKGKKVKSKTAKVSAEQVATNNSNNTNEVIITDIKMRFGSMVIFMVKWAIASIPAMIILFLVGFLVMGVFGVGIATLFK